MIRTEQYIQLKTKANEIQQLNPSEPDNRHSIIRPQPAHVYTEPKL